MIIRSFIVCVFVIRLMGACLQAEQPAEPSEGEKLFALKVKGLLVEKCNACHGDDPEEIQGGLDMLSRESLMRGGDSWAKEVVLPGDPHNSALYVAVTRKESGFEMPPKEAEKLTQEETWWIRDWIDQGAPWPGDDRVRWIQQHYAEGELVETSGGLSSDWTNRRYQPERLWAYRPLNVVPVPETKHPVDWFINQMLEDLGLDAAGDAEPRELVRRFCFGMTGLPPTVEQTRQFIERYEENPSDAVHSFASELMESHHYGEHFARQWLDVVRYADSAGFANDYCRPNAWRYRDYVVRSFNQDRPYNEFVRQQIAGDEMDPDDPENQIAVGFLRMGPWEQTGMSVFKITRQQWLDDVTDSVGQTFLAHAMQCCKCHDHKFDPIPTRDYYQMMAVFSTTQFAEPDTPFLELENQNGFRQANAWTRAKIAAYQKQRNELNGKVGKQRVKESGDAKVGDNGLDPGDEASLARMAKNISRHNWEYDRTRPISLSVYTGSTVTRQNVKSRLTLPQAPWGRGAMEKDAILSGGDVFSPIDSVTPGPLSAAESLGRMPKAQFPSGRGKRRLALADWIVDPKNPLTARVIVNRVWAWHFGTGLAGNPNNFGATGKLPTHPALLDYLADWLVRHDWSLKQLNQLIVTSRAYRRRSRHPDYEALNDKDPGRSHFAVFNPRRLTSEELRDAMLSASGELNHQLGGIPCRPDINWEVAMQPRQIMGGTASVYEPDPLPSQRNRRSLYAEKIRGLRDPFHEAFNQPGPDKSCELRETSTVAPQALTLMNAQEIHDRALAFAARLMKECDTDPDRIQRAFQLSLGRPASDAEEQSCLNHLKDATRAETGKHYEIRSMESQVVRTVMAEKTGEPYDFVEVMPAYESYISDLQPGQTDAETRGLAQVCLVLFNLNEFSYLD